MGIVSTHWFWSAPSSPPLMSMNRILIGFLSMPNSSLRHSASRALHPHVMALLRSLPDHPFTRRLADRGLGAFARRRVAVLDRRDPERTQERTLLRLVRDAQHTRFGHEHDFAGIRSVKD